jgi:inward rectifier potassium channel
MMGLRRSLACPITRVPFKMEGIAMAAQGSPAPPTAPADRAPSDLGFGTVVTRRRGYRLINRDGSFNVRLNRGQWWGTVFSYHTLLSMSWRRLFALLAAGFLVTNGLFAAAYLACGPGALAGADGLGRIARAFFFSVHTLATIGYGSIVPASLAANFVVTLESLVGLLGLAVATGVVFARFSRPVADIRYSTHAVVAPYGGITAFEFRVVNGRRNQLVNLSAVVMMSRFEGEPPNRQRRFQPLPLERSTVAFFPMNWTVVHPIDEASPLWGWDAARLLDAEAEFAVLLTAVDETFSQTVHSRSSYTAEEVRFGHRFEMMFSEDDQEFVLDLEKLSATRPV